MASMVDKKDNFFVKNIKIFFIVVVVLFLFKSIQGCNRSNSINKLNKKITYISDSLNNRINNLNDSIKTLNNLVKIEQIKANYSNDRANAIQKTASSITKNTRIEIKTDNSNNTNRK